MSNYTLKPGVVTGEGYKTLVEAAKSGGYALPAVNVTGTNTINAVMEAAAKANSDIIIQLSNSGGQFYAGRGIKDAFIVPFYEGGRIPYAEAVERLTSGKN